jgi:hypothetical protein
MLFPSSEQAVSRRGERPTKHHIDAASEILQRAWIANLGVDTPSTP